mmetsp:Transcript_21205/g.68606  ORF Transcript_21205/g.68606 Transcript_21205/m.68606 type:complete len:274 (-) Transcript_21205:711-1532(-)
MTRARDRRRSLGAADGAALATELALARRVDGHPALVAGTYIGRLGLQGHRVFPSQRREVCHVGRGNVAVVAGPREEAAVEARQGAGRREQACISREQPHLVTLQREGVGTEPRKRGAVSGVELPQLAEVPQEDVVDLPEDLGLVRVTSAAGRQKTAAVVGQGQAREVGQVRAAGHELRALGRRRLAVLQHAIFCKRPLVDSAVLECMPPCAVLHVVLPLSAIPSSVGIEECPEAVALTPGPLALVAVVHLLLLVERHDLPHEGLGRAPRLRRS